MKYKEMFNQLGYDFVEDSADRIVFVKYFRDLSLPKYKRPCLKIIFNHGNRSLVIKGRNEKGNQASYDIDVSTLKTIYQTEKELGWIN
jgi:hypothetical protein